MMMDWGDGLVDWWIGEGIDYYGVKKRVNEFLKLCLIIIDKKGVRRTWMSVESFEHE